MVAALFGVEPQLRRQASESRLKSCRSPRVLHLATHGFFLGDQDLEDQRLQAMLDAQPWMEDAVLEARRAAREKTMLDRLMLFGWIGVILQPDLLADLYDLNHEMVSVRRLVSVAGQLAELELENPLLRSGLALAGANAGLRGAATSTTEDGILTAEDVAGLDLRATEIVVLSACETGLGDLRAGEGVFGLRRAFVLAGAKTLVMSLWKVPDEQTQELMVNFYQRLLAGEGRAEALRHAQLDLKARYPEPFYWGAFHLPGGPRSPPDFLKRKSLRARSHMLGELAKIGVPRKNLSSSSARFAALGYRCSGCFARHFMQIESRSRGSRLESFAVGSAAAPSDSQVSPQWIGHEREADRSAARTGLFPG